MQSSARLSPYEYTYMYPITTGYPRISHLLLHAYPPTGIRSFAMPPVSQVYSQHYQGLCLISFLAILANCLAGTPLANRSACAKPMAVSPTDYLYSQIVLTVTFAKIHSVWIILVIQTRSNQLLRDQDCGWVKSVQLIQQSLADRHMKGFYRLFGEDFAVQQ